MIEKKYVVRIAMILILVLCVALTGNKVIEMNTESKTLNTEVVYARKLAELLKSAEDMTIFKQMILEMDKDAVITEVSVYSKICCDFSDDYSAVIDDIGDGYYMITLSKESIQYSIKVVKVA